MRSNAYCGNLLWQSSLTLQAHEGALRGVGDVRFVMGAKLGCDICLWMPAVLAVAAFDRSLLALWWTMPAFFAVLSTVLFLRFRSGVWIRRRLSA